MGGEEDCKPFRKLSWLYIEESRKVAGPRRMAAFNARLRYRLGTRAYERPRAEDLFGALCFPLPSQDEAV
jgi:hypothetical protein